MSLYPIPLKLSVIIPVYNEESTVGEVIQKVRSVDIPKEIIVVDDGSTDKTAQAIEKEKKKKGDKIRAYYSPVNFGKGAGIRIGYKFAMGDIIIIQDADLELNPNEYSQLIKPILEGKSKVVYGSRFKRSNKNIRLITRIGNKFVTSLFNLLYGAKLTDIATGYKVLKREVVKSLNLRAVGFDIEPEMTAKIYKKGIKIIEVPVKYNPRVGEGKKINYFRDTVKYILTIFKYRIFD